MLIDNTHRRWFIVTVVLAVAAVALHRLLIPRLDDAKGGSTVGLYYGVVGTLLMIYAGLLAAHRRMPVKRRYFARQTWLRGHLWLGALSVVFILCHSGYSWGGPVEIALWVVLLGVVATGVVGLVLQQILPRLLTSRVRCEAPNEQVPHLCEVMRREADNLIDSVCGPFDPSPQNFDNTLAAFQYAINARAQLRDFYEQDIRPFLSPDVPKKSSLLNPLEVEARFSKLRRLPGMDELKEQVDQVALYCQERRALMEQERIHFWLHVWLLVHIPLSVALLVLGTVHIVMSLYY